MKKKEEIKNKIDLRYNPNNEVMKYKFFHHLEHSAEGKDPKTVRAYMNALHEFEISINFKDFKKYKEDWSVNFKHYLLNKKNQRTKETISKSYYHHYVSFSRQFFQWLAKQKDYKNIEEKGINMLYISKNDTRQAKAQGIPKRYTIEEILSTIRKIPNQTEIQKRDKAIISLCILTGARIQALMTTRIFSIKLLKEYHNTWFFDQNPRYIDTKTKKQINSFFISQTQDLIENVITWQAYLKEKGFKNKDPLFPKIVPSFDKNSIQIFQLKKELIASQNTMREIFERAFKNNDLPYINPHSFRHSIAYLMKKSSNSSRLIPALHENFGHAKGLALALSVYGRDYLHDQAEVLREFKFE